MASSYGPPWIHGPMPRRGYRYSTLHLRVSDAERAEVADRLSKHYADGRLDQAEFSARLDQAMGAKTQADLDGLFTDLPPIEGSQVATRRPRARSHSHVLLFVVLVLAITATIGHTVMRFYHPWLLLGVLISLWMLRHDHLRRRG
jgi:Domain of unknown function (DUF1707)